MHEIRVPSVEIVPEVELTIAHEGSEIQDEHGQLSREGRVLVRTGPAHRGRDPGRVPPQHPRRQLVGSLDADAPMAERTHVAIEQGTLRGVVQVDVVAVRKDELRVPERIQLAGPLSNADPAGAYRRRRELSATYHGCIVAIAAHHLVVV